MRGIRSLIPVFQRRLLRWYRRHQRPLPWRKTHDPYKILVSEIMLQQTQVERVIPKYREFLRYYPTVKELANARPSDVRKVWYPLGYNIRPTRLHQIARRVVKEHHGRIPNSYDGLIAMDGVGRYTAGAVLSFAFNQDAPALDTNVARLLQRYFGLPRPQFAPSDRQGRANRVRETLRFGKSNRRGKLGRGLPRLASKGRAELWELAARVIPRGKAYEINQAMMDFGALVCTARRPKCPTCVLRRSCRSYPVV